MLSLNTVLQATSKDNAPFAGMVRVIAQSRDTLYVWLIVVADAVWNSYPAGPFRRLRSEVEGWLTDRRAVVYEWPVPGMWLMTDDDIKKNLPKRSDGRYPALEKRDADWSLIENLVRKHTTSSILEDRRCASWVKSMVLAKRVAPKRVYSALHRFWASGCHENCLLAMFSQRGGAGLVRHQKRKLGRQNARVRRGEKEFAGYLLTPTDIDNLQFGWDNYKVRGMSVNEAYLETMAVYWRQGVKRVDNVPQPVLLEAWKRPSRRQFEYWGPKGEGNQSASRIELAPNEFERDHRPLPGTSRDGIVAFGDTASLDAVCGDVQLVSVASRLKPVGTVTRIPVRDSDTGYIAGFYAGFDAPSAATALLAIANAADSKINFCARYGITITDEEWPPYAFHKYLGDNGELRNEKSMETIPGWGASIEYAQSGRAERKPVESDHRSSQARVDHKMVGTTHGRRKNRGEKDPVTQAALNHYEYVRQHIKRVLQHNNVDPVPELLTLEMRQDGVVPTRLNIVKWKLRNGYGTLFQPPVEILRAHLLPPMRATINRRGLFLLRNDRGNKREIVRGARFVSAELVNSGLMERGRTEVESVTVRVDPNDLACVWLPTKQGLKKVPNVHPDKLMVEQATLHDLLDIQDDDALRALVGKTETDQNETEFVVDRTNASEAAVKAREVEIMASGKKPSDASLRRFRRDNRAAEKASLERRGRKPKAMRHTKTTAVSPSPKPVPNPAAQNPLIDALRAAMKEQP